jgi:biopolymer transport protein TolR
MGASINRSGRGGRRRGSRPMAEINVTPFVDVMLVLLIVFMITAPMLATGVAVDLPKTRAEPLPASEQQPLVVTIDRDGDIYLGTLDEPIPMEEVAPRLVAVAGENLERRVYVRGDDAVAYGKVVTVLAILQSAGFTNAGMVVDPETAQRMIGGR